MQVFVFHKVLSRASTRNVPLMALNLALMTFAFFVMLGTAKADRLQVGSMVLLCVVLFYSLGLLMAAAKMFALPAQALSPASPAQGRAYLFLVWGVCVVAGMMCAASFSRPLAYGFLAGLPFAVLANFIALRITRQVLALAGVFAIAKAEERWGIVAPFADSVAGFAVVMLAALLHVRPGVQGVVDPLAARYVPHVRVPVADRMVSRSLASGLGRALDWTFPAFIAGMAFGGSIGLALVPGPGPTALLVAACLFVYVCTEVVFRMTGKWLLALRVERGVLSLAPVLPPPSDMDAALGRLVLQRTVPVPLTGLLTYLVASLVAFGTLPPAHLLALPILAGAIPVLTFIRRGVR